MIKSQPNFLQSQSEKTLSQNWVNFQKQLVAKAGLQVSVQAG